MDIDKVNRLFYRARRDLYYPPITKVEISDISTSEIDFSARTYKVLIGEEFIKKIDQGALLGIFHHELNHWAKHPYDAKTILLEHHFLPDIENKNIIRNLYDDVVVNLDLIVNKGLEDVAKVYRQLPAKSRADRLFRAFYKAVTGIDFGRVEIDEELDKRLKMLFQIDFLDTSMVKIKKNIRRFCKIVQDLIDEEITLPFSIFGIGDLPPQEIKKAIKEIANEVGPQEYREIAKEVFKEINYKKLEEKKGVGIAPGDKSLAKELDRPDIGWYKARAQRYTIYINPFLKGDSLYPYEIKDFDLDDNIDTYAPIDSYGKCLPGLAKRYELKAFEGHEPVHFPDAVIMIDSSGSMRNPDKDISHAVIGAFAIARNYFEHGSKVGVINFSNINIQLEPTNERERVYETLKLYQCGGTTLHLKELKEYVDNIGEKKTDFILITDAGIDNVSEVLDYFSKLRYRLTIIWIKGDVKGYESFKERYKLLKERLPLVSFFEVEDEEDIPYIAVGRGFYDVYGGN